MRVIGATIRGAFSGSDDDIFRALSSRGLLVGVEDGRLPDAWKVFYLFTTLHLSRLKWYHAWQHAMTKTTAAFRARTRRLDKALRCQLGTFDIVLQAGGLFAPFEGEFARPVCLWCDYTSKLAELNYTPWFGLNGRGARNWYSLEQDLYRRCAVIFATSEYTRSSLIQHYGVRPELVQVVGVGVPEIFEHQGKSYDEQTILFVGIDFDRKGGPILLRAFAEIRKRLPRAKLLIAGPRPGTEQPGVEWMGHVVGREKVNQLFAGATVLAIPSICDPFPRVVFEGMSHGLPVVGSATDGIPEMISDGESGLLVPSGDPASLADKLTCLLSSPQLCAKMGSAGKALVSKKFLWKQVVDRIEDGLRAACQSS